VDEKDSKSSHPGPGNGQYVAVSAGGGKSHLSAAIGYALVENGWRVLFARTTDLVQKLQVARRDLALESALAKLDKYHLLILDDFAYVANDQTATSVLFELIAHRPTHCVGRLRSDRMDPGERTAPSLAWTGCSCSAAVAT
jgi:chromosomal replication initiation ATPase DnaA